MIIKLWEISFKYIIYIFSLKYILQDIKLEILQELPFVFIFTNDTKLFYKKFKIDPVWKLTNEYRKLDAQKNSFDENKMYMMQF